eukprot:TRINITY_DN8532_c0_g1_i2.p2 TRINITY_DN8532_c0_g1~~TRINITY_DN8532_c0_g1_i2.p2  ORF type:complete len:160 (-),score=64.70 TRINITY_DN8532_c0_g1_i2:78-557(-)
MNNINNASAAPTPIHSTPASASSSANPITVPIPPTTSTTIASSSSFSSTAPNVGLTPILKRKKSVQINTRVSIISSLPKRPPLDLIPTADQQVSPSSSSSSPSPSSSIDTAPSPSVDAPSPNGADLAPRTSSSRGDGDKKAEKLSWTKKISMKMRRIVR